jgi:hypothetical protein
VLSAEMRPGFARRFGSVVKAARPRLTDYAVRAGRL